MNPRTPPWMGAVLFLHVPKTAGSTLRSIIRAQYPQEATFEMDDVTTHQADFERLPPEKRASLRCVMGHIRFGAHAFLPHPSTYITLLRDPVERMISHYYFVKSQGPDSRWGEHYLHRRVIDDNLSLQDYASIGLDPELDNGQARFISGLWLCSDARELLETAKRNLATSFHAFGPTERFDDVLGLFARRLGWAPIAYVRENVSPDRPKKSQVDGQTIRRIEECNAVDMELYDWSARRFEEMLRER